MKSIHCDVIQDLLPSYSDKISSKETNLLVEEHLKSCEKCRKKLESLNKELNINLVSNQQENKEIEFLKKYNRKMTILKFVATLLFTIILIIWIILGGYYIRKRNDYKNAEHIYEIMNKTFEKTEEIENSNNYTLIVEYIYDGNKKNNNMEILKYKDGKFKKEHRLSYKGEDSSFINYGVAIEDMKLFAQYDVADSTWNPYCGEVGKIYRNTFDLFYKDDIMEYINYSIRDDNYEGKEYYAISYGQNGESEIWIDKESMLLSRWIPNITSKNTWTKYTWEINNVTDEEIKIEDENVEREFQKYLEKFK